MAMRSTQLPSRVAAQCHQRPNEGPLHLHRKTAMIVILLLLGLLFALRRLHVMTLDLSVTLSPPGFIHALTVPGMPLTGPTPTPAGTEFAARETQDIGHAAGDGNSASATTDPGQGAKSWIALDTARISPDGASVFAGRAAPFAYVTVLEGSTPVVTGQAGADGDWSLVTEHKFAGLDPKFSLSASDNPPTSPSSLTLASPIPPSARTGSPASPSDRLIKEFENAVAVAREQATHNDAVANGDHVATQTESSNSGPETGNPAQASPAQRQGSIPLPMTFIYDEATLTAEGRRASELLAEYLTLKHYTAVTLSGHADERGSSDYNMELSRQRLDTILRLLRDEGYKGKVDLLPKGASEPYSGVDRSVYPREQLMQLDRRVELREAR